MLLRHTVHMKLGNFKLLKQGLIRGKQFFCLLLFKKARPSTAAQRSFLPTAEVVVTAICIKVR